MNPTLRPTLAALTAAALLGACNANPPRASACVPPEGNNLDAAMAQSRADLGGVCSFRFDSYFARLLEIGEGNPDPENRRRFSEFLVWSQQAGLLNTNQAQDRYNRYFNLKFVALKGDFNTCATTCRDQAAVMRAMERELADKELGLLRVSRDAIAYQRADRLFQEAELVLEATCTACAAR